MSNLKKYYQEEGINKLKKELDISNNLLVPKLQKVVINISLGEALSNKNVIDSARKQLEIISGQRPIVTYAKKDISTFKLRKGDAIGLKVTLRSDRMYIFLEKLIKIALPRIRDFRGVPDKSFDKSGNYTLGIEEQIVFPELEYNQIDKIRGLEVTIVTSAKNKKDTKKLLEVLGLPFEKNLNKQK